MIFPKVAPAVIVGVINGDKILLTKYANREYKRYALIAGFNEIGETIEGTVRREVMEEAGLKIKNIRYYKSQPWGFDSNLLMGFFCEVDGSDNIRLDENELSEAEWVARDDIPEYGENLSLTHEMMQVFKTALF
jgi:NAD+ diphosphatase